LRVNVLHIRITKSSRWQILYRFYEGLKQRFEQHNIGLVGSTKHRRPFKLIYYEACHDQKDATKREKYLKTFHGKMFLKRRLKSYLSSEI
jgi:putative endonuclease